MIIKYNEIANKIHLMPINSVWIYKKYSALEQEDVSIYFNNPEADSNYKILAKNKTDMYGGNRLLGYMIDITAYFPYNDFTADYVKLLDTLPNIANEPNISFWQFVLFIGNNVPYSQDLHYVNSTNSNYIKLTNPSISVEIESVELRPRISLKINQFINKLEGHILR